MASTTSNKRSSTRSKHRSGKKPQGICRAAKAYMSGFVVLCSTLLSLMGYNVAGCNKLDNDQPAYPDNHIDGLDRVVTAANTPEQFIAYEGMNVSFNPKAHIPNWVAWELTAEEAMGTEPRAQNFIADDKVAGCPQPWEYSYSGYDRGHMAPAGDMKWSPLAMAQSFYMTNVCPQVKSFNSGTWKRLEEKCRTWALADSAIVIVAGPILTGDIMETIGDRGIVVPKRFFKVVLAPYADPPRGIGFIMDNGRVDGGMQRAAVTIDSVEAVTGHDFFSSLPDDVERNVESQCKFHFWSSIKP